MNCPACGKTNPDGAVFCEQCGTSLRAQPASPGVAAPPPPPPSAASAAATVTTAQLAQQGQALLAAMSLGEKISGAGAIVAIIAFFLPWVSVAIPILMTADTATSLSGLDLGKTIGAVYFIPLLAAVAAALCYFSSKAAPPRKLLFAGYLVFIGALCGPANLLALIFVSEVHAMASFGLWLFSLGYTAIAAGGLFTIQGFSKRGF